MTGSPCLVRDIAMPADCVVTDDAGAVTDYTLVADPQMCPEGQHLRLERAGAAAGTTTVSCTLSAIAGGLPNVHIGVVTSDVGTKGAEDSSPGPMIGTGAGACSGTGKAGNLQTSGSTTLTGNFISDVAVSSGGRATNYTGS